MRRQITQLDDHIRVRLASADGRGLYETDNGCGSALKDPQKGVALLRHMTPDGAIRVGWVLFRL